MSTRPGFDYHGGVNSGGGLMIKPESMKAGSIVSLDLVPRTTPYSCCIGLVKDVNKSGISINPARWDNARGITLSREDLYIPWININSMMVCPAE